MFVFCFFFLGGGVTGLYLFYYVRTSCEGRSKITGKIPVTLFVLGEF